jgi:hypothetical protein
MTKRQRPRRPRPERRTLTTALRAYHAPVDLIEVQTDEDITAILLFAEPVTLKTRNLDGINFHTATNQIRTVIDADQISPTLIRVTLSGAYDGASTYSVTAPPPGLSRLINFAGPAPVVV